MLALCSSGLETSLSVYLVPAVYQLYGLRCDNMTTQDVEATSTIALVSFSDHSHCPVLIAYCIQYNEMRKVWEIIK